MAESIFTSQIPTSPQLNDGQAIVTGTTFTVATTGTITGIRFYTPAVDVVGVTYTVSLWEVVDNTTGTPLASRAVNNLTTTSTFNTVPLTAPVSVSPGVKYRAAVHTFVGSYVATSNFFLSSPLVNGNLTAIQTGTDTINNGVFSYTGAAVTYPVLTFNGGCYFVDVVFEASVADTVFPDGITMPMTFGEPTVATQMTVTPDSILIPLILGQPFVSGAPSPGVNDLVPALYEQALQCLCDATAANPGTPALCVPRVGTSVVFDVGQYTDLCCKGISYIMLGDMYISESSFPEQDIVQQIRGQCAPPTWAVDFKLGIVRCISAGQPNGDPPLETDQILAARQNIYDAQSLRAASCCFRNWLTVQYGTLYDGMNVVINRQVQGDPQGGCVERYVTLTVQFPDIDCGCP